MMSRRVVMVSVNKAASTHGRLDSERLGYHCLTLSAYAIPSPVDTRIS